MAEHPEIDTPAGRVRGRAESGLAVFRGIPFAAPPVGPRRFGAPEPPAPWSDVLDASGFGPIPPQSDVGRGTPPSPPDDGRGWLTANVWSADLAGRAPVLVWIQGGAYRSGHAADPTYDGTLLAREGGVVVVTFNHRVGVEGYGQLGGAPANRGILDQVAALTWVRDAIAAFGGDPERVTVFGESAGAGAVAALLAMPSARGLFARAVLQSVPGTFLARALADDIMTTIAARLDRAATVADLRDVEPDELVAAADAVALGMREHRDRWGLVALTPTPFSPVVDGEVLPTTPWEALRAGAARDVEIVVGHNRDEFRLFVALGGLLGAVPDELAAATLDAFAPDADAYRAAFPDAKAAELFELVQSDWLFRMPSLRIAQEQVRAGGRAHVYELTATAPGQGGVLGACHGLDVPLTFGTLSGGGFLTDVLLGTDPPARIHAASAAIRTAWAAFAHTGEPGWPAYDDDRRATWVLDAEPVVAPYPEEASHALWAGHEFAPLPFTGS